MSVSQFSIWELIKEKNQALTLPFPYNCINQLSNCWWDKVSLCKTTPANTWRTHDKIECYCLASCNESRYWRWWLLTSCKRPWDTVCALVAEHSTTWETVLPKPSNLILIKLSDPTIIYRKHQGWRKMMVIMRTWPSKSRVWDTPEDEWPGSFNNNWPGWELMMEGKLIRLKRYSNQMK